MLFCALSGFVEFHGFLVIFGWLAFNYGMEQLRPISTNLTNLVVDYSNLMGEGRKLGDLMTEIYQNYFYHVSWLRIQVLC